MGQHLAFRRQGLCRIGQRKDERPALGGVYQRARRWIATGVFEANLVHDLRAVLRPRERS